MILKSVMRTAMRASLRLKSVKCFTFEAKEGRFGSDFESRFEKTEEPKKNWRRTEKVPYMKETMEIMSKSSRV